MGHFGGYPKRDVPWVCIDQGAATCGSPLGVAGAELSLGAGGFGSNCFGQWDIRCFGEVELMSAGVIFWELTRVL